MLSDINVKRDSLLHICNITYGPIIIEILTKNKYKHSMMYKIIFTSCIFLLFPIQIFANQFTEIQLDSVTLKYVSYKVGSQDYSIDVAVSETAQTLEEIAKENGAITAINGIFFCPEDYSRCNGKNYTINERFVDGEDLSFYDDTGERGVFAWDVSGVPFLFRTRYINATKRDEIYEWMWNFPILLSNGKNQITYYDSIGLLDKKMTVAAPRHFICSNKEKTEIIFWRSNSISLAWLAQELWNIWCFDALNLDAGLSSYYIYNGRNLVTGKRKVIDAFIITSKYVDVPAIEAKLDIVFEKYFSPLQYGPKIKWTKIIQAYLTAFTQARKNIYKNNSIDLYDADWKNRGYQIDITDPKVLNTMYIINSFENRLKIMVQAMKK